MYDMYSIYTLCMYMYKYKRPLCLAVLAVVAKVLGPAPAAATIARDAGDAPLGERHGAGEAAASDGNAAVDAVAAAAFGFGAAELLGDLVPHLLLAGR